MSYGAERVGQRMRVRDCYGAYRLPHSLPEFAEVTLVSFDHGYWEVRHQGKLYEVALPCVGNSGILTGLFIAIPFW